MLMDRVTPTLIGSKTRPRASTSARNSAMRSRICSKEAYWSSNKLKPSAATFRMEAALPAPIQSGGCGFCAVGGSTTTLSNCQYLPRWLHGTSDVQALTITSSDSSKRPSASSMGVAKPANSLYR